MRQLRQRIDRSSVLVCVQDNMDADRRTHENEDSVGILLPALDHLVVFLLCGLGIDGEERPRAVTEAGFFRFVIWRWPSSAAIYFI